MLFKGEIRQVIEGAFDTVGRVQARNTKAPAALFAIANALDLGVYEVTIGGRTLFAALERRGGGNQGSSITGVTLHVRIPDVPFRISVSGRRRLGAIGEPVDLGDPAFSADLDVHATSGDLARELLDAPTRARIHATYARTEQAGVATYLSTARDKLQWFVPVRAHDHGLLSPGVPMTAEELRAGAADLLGLADRLVAAFERRRADAFARGGQAAADAFVAGEQAALVRAKQRFDADVVRLVIALVVGMALFALLILGVTGAIAIWQLNHAAPDHAPRSSKHAR